MGINFDVNSAAAISKQRYTDKVIETLMFQSPLLGLMPKASNYGGTAYNGSMRPAVQSTVSASDSVAFTAGGPSQYVAWQCPWREGYASANLTGRAIDQCNGDENALVDVMVGEEDGAYIALGVHLASAIWGNGGGAIGKVSSGSTVASTTITLANPNDIVKFYQGQILNASVSDDGTGGGAPIGGLSTPSAATVVSVDETLGTVTIGSNWSVAFSGITAGTSYLFNQGDFGAKLQGIPAWIPDVNNRSGLSTPFNGVTRSNSPIKLAGHYYQGNGAPKGESVNKLLTLINRLNPKSGITHFFANPVDYVDIVNDFGSRVQVVTEAAFKQPQIGFQGIEVASSNGVVRIFQDPFVPQGNGYAIDMKTWLLPSMGKVPKVLGKDVDGNEWLRQGGSDSYQKRFGYRAATYCSAPGKNGVVTW